MAISEMNYTGGGYKCVEGTFETANGTKTITVDGLNNIEFVFAYYSLGYDNAIHCAGQLKNGVFTSMPWYGQVSNKISAISGNTFSITWGSVDSGWKYIAYGT